MMSPAASRQAPGAGSSAPQPRACQVCATSKAKCTSRPGSKTGKCDRCNRLKKECLPGQPVQKKPRRPRSNRTAQLEQKVDSLVALLTTAQKPAQGLSPDADARRVVSLEPTDGSLTSWTDALAPGIDPSLIRSPRSNCYVADDLLTNSVLISPANDQLNSFQNDMTSFFPFIVVPEDMTVEKLRTTKPFLYENIMMVTSTSNLTQQSRLRSDVIKSFINQIFAQGKKSLDLLQGILVFAAWYHHYLSPSPQLTNIIQLATALVFDLGLHRTQNLFDGNDISSDGITSFRSTGVKLPRTLEERRAFLGLFCLSRGLAANIGKIQPLQNTPYVEECCLELEKRQEYLTDRYLVLQVRFQNISDNALRSFPFSHVDYWGELGTETIIMLVNSFERDLERFKIMLEPGIVQSALFQVHVASISIHNTKIALRRSPLSEITKPTSKHKRLALLMTCLQSTKTFFTEWVSLPISVYHCLPIHIFALVANAAVILGMLNLFEYDGWDLDYVRSIAPFSLTMDEVARKYEQASQKTNNSENSGYTEFWRDGIKMKRLRDWYEARLRQEECRTANSENWVEIDSDLFNEQFWNEIVGGMAYDNAM